MFSEHVQPKVNTFHSNTVLAREWELYHIQTDRYIISRATIIIIAHMFTLLRVVVVYKLVFVNYLICSPCIVVKWYYSNGWELHIFFFLVFFFHWVNNSGNSSSLKQIKITENQKKTEDRSITAFRINKQTKNLLSFNTLNKSIYSFIFSFVSSSFHYLIVLSYISCTCLCCWFFLR